MGDAFLALPMPRAVFLPECELASINDDLRCLRDRSLRAHEGALLYKCRD